MLIVLVALACVVGGNSGVAAFPSLPVDHPVHQTMPIFFLLSSFYLHTYIEKHDIKQKVIHIFTKPLLFDPPRRVLYANTDIKQPLRNFTSLLPK